jgi:hypothetical protein
MKIIKTAKYEKIAQRDPYDYDPPPPGPKEVSYQEVFNDALKMYNGNERKAAEVVLDFVTTGMWAMWDGAKINDAIQQILDKFGKPDFPDTPMGMEDDNPAPGIDY